MISVSDNQLRIVAEAADLLPAEARGTFLRRVVAEVREGRSFKDSDIERAVRVALFDQSMKRASVANPPDGRVWSIATAGPAMSAMPGARRPAMAVARSQSVFAVLRLMLNSNLVGWKMGIPSNGGGHF